MSTGNLFVNYLGLFFFMSPEGIYLLWPPTVKKGMLPPQNEWFRIRTEHNLTPEPLTQQELHSASIIHDLLKSNKFYGIPPQKKNVLVKPTSPQIVAPVQKPKSKHRLQKDRQTASIIHFQQALGDTPVEKRKGGQAIVVALQSNEIASTFNNVPGFEKLRERFVVNE